MRRREQWQNFLPSATNGVGVESVASQASAAGDAASDIVAASGAVSASAAEAVNATDGDAPSVEATNQAGATGVAEQEEGGNSLETPAKSKRGSARCCAAVAAMLTTHARLQRN